MTEGIYEEVDFEANKVLYQGIRYTKLTLPPNERCHTMTEHDKILIDKRSGRAILVRRSEKQQDNSDGT